MHVLNLVFFFLRMKFACVAGKQKIKKKRTKQIISRAQDENDPITDNVIIA